MPFENLKAVILTHQDIDHIGGEPALTQEAGHDITIYAHELECPYIEGGLPLIKTDISRMTKEKAASLPEEIRQLSKTLRR
ncbi:MBL fold metallo-hydrolase [Bacillus atrophaeus]|uniref:MBL fold metallo-hydrolase n=1 Tax=Bacillus atrophaeus TaxID=1452 RepID=UPI003873AD77